MIKISQQKGMAAGIKDRAWGGPQAKKPGMVSVTSHTPNEGSKLHIFAWEGSTILEFLFSHLFSTQLVPLLNSESEKQNQGGTPLVTSGNKQVLCGQLQSV